MLAVATWSSNSCHSICSSWHHLLYRGESSFEFFSPLLFIYLNNCFCFLYFIKTKNSHITSLNHWDHYIYYALLLSASTSLSLVILTLLLWWRICISTRRRIWLTTSNFVSNITIINRHLVVGVNVVIICGLLRVVFLDGSDDGWINFAK